MRKIIPMLIVALLITACTTLDCPMNNTVSVRFALRGPVDTLADTLTIAEKLKKTGVEPALMIKHKMFHDYLLAIKYCREAKQAANFAIKFMKSVETRDN